MNNTKLMINLESITFTVTSSLSLLATINIPQGQTVFFSLVAIGPKGTREIPGITYPLKNEDINLQKLQCVAGGISPEETNFCAVFRTADHATVAYQLPDSSRLYSPLPLIAQLLRDLPDDMLAIVHSLHEGVGQSIRTLWGEGLANRIMDETAFGSQSAVPRYSVVIPYYGRYDFARHQLAAFSEDPCFTGGRAEVVFVLDKPEDLTQFISVVSGLDTAFGVPFRLVVPEKNLGYAGANNLGVDRARGEFVCLLNSDVLPAGPGWLESLASHFELVGDVGAMGALLLYENETIQHAGMAFSLLPGTDWYINDHPLKGLGLEFLPQRGVLPMAAVSGACMLLRRSQYLEIGGLDTAFLRGDFEDSDLCLRLRQSGKSIYVDLDTKLYHLERQSFAAAPERMKFTLYNAWLQNARWKNELLYLSRIVAPIQCGGLTHVISYPDAGPWASPL